MLKIIQHHVLAFLSRRAPSLTRCYLRRILFRPKRLFPSTDVLSFFESGRTFSLSFKERRICGWEWGRAPYILFIHGWNGSSCQFVPFLKIFLKNGIGVMAFDFPAHGQSEGSKTNCFDIMDAIKTVVCSFERNRIMGMIAHSMGGGGVVSFLSAYRNDLPAVLIAPALKLRKLSISVFHRMGIPEDTYNPFLLSLENESGYFFDRDDPFYLLEKIVSDVLIIHDEEDRTVSIDDSVDAARQNKNILLVKTRGLGHKMVLKDEEVMRTALNFLLSADRLKNLGSDVDEPVNMGNVSEKSVRYAGTGEDVRL